MTGSKNYCRAIDCIGRRWQKLSRSITHFFKGLALRESLQETTTYHISHGKKKMVSFLWPADFFLGPVLWFLYMLDQGQIWSCLVGGLEHVLFYHILGLIVPSPKWLIFVRGFETTNQSLLLMSRPWPFDLLWMVQKNLSMIRGFIFRRCLGMRRRMLIDMQIHSELWIRLTYLLGKIDNLWVIYLFK